MQLDLFRNVKINQQDKASVKLIGGRVVSYSLKRSQRAKHVWLKIGIGTGLEVVAPAKMSLKTLGGVLEKKSAWIQKHLFRADLMDKSRKMQTLKDGIMLPYLGERRRLRVLASRGRINTVKLLNGEIIAAVPGNDPETLRLALEAWYRKMARKVIIERVSRFSYGKKIGTITIKDQKTRWGSCSTIGNLNFNWRLIMAPPSVIDYLIVHELTHLDHPDHSKRFWNKVAKRCPTYTKSEDWLKEHGRSLTLA